MIVAISSANALAYNICHYMLIQRISGVATTVIGEVKIVGLMILSAALLGACVASGRAGGRPAGGRAAQQGLHPCATET